MPPEPFTHPVTSLPYSGDGLLMLMPMLFALVLLPLSVLGIPLSASICLASDLVVFSSTSYDLLASLLHQH